MTKQKETELGTDSSASLKSKKKSPLPKLVHPEQNEDAMKHLRVSLVAFFDTARKLKDENGAIKLRITYNRIFKLYSTGISVTEEEYKNICSHRPKLEMRDKKRYVFSYLKRAHDIIVELDEFSFDAFDKKYKSKRKTNDILSYFDNYMEELKQENRFGNAESYWCAKHKLEVFAKSSTIPFETIDVAFLKRFENWMISDNCSPTTVGIYCRCIKKLFNDAIREEDIKADKYPFGSIKKGLYSPPEPRNIKKALSLSDIKKIVDYKPKEGSQEHYYRDIWVFSYLGNGINLKDICLLKYKHINGKYIHFDRAKTINTNRKAKPISIPLIDANMSIITRWGNPKEDMETYLFPILNGIDSIESQRFKIKLFTQYLNKAIKRIARKLELEGNITSYTARHSFATVLKRSGTDIAFISEALGHSDLKTTESYLDSFEDETRKANTLKLLDFSSIEEKKPSSNTAKVNKKPSSRTSKPKKKASRKK